MRAGTAEAVPSFFSMTVAPEDAVILINPSHQDAGAITAVKLLKWLYDPGLR